MLKRLFQTVLRLSRYRLMVGVDLDRINGRAIVLFPVWRHTFFCGLAGILAIKKEDVAAKESGLSDDPVDYLITAFQKVNLKSLQKILSGFVKPQQYLDSREFLAEMDKNILLLKGDAQCKHIYFSPDKFIKLIELCKKIGIFLSEEEKLLEESADHFHTDELEIIYSQVILLKDILWTLEKDFLANIEKIKALCPEGVSEEGFRKYREMNFLLNCLDRLEVRGRDSAGLQISFTLSDPGDFDRICQDLQGRGLYETFLARINKGDLVNGSIEFSDRLSNESSSVRGVSLSFTYKTASIIGELGRNVRELRQAISRDRVFHAIAGSKAGFEVAFAHTRWASVGSITEENCHPVNNATLTELRQEGPSIQSVPQNIKQYPLYGQGNWRVNVVLNGDIDNYQALRRALESADQSGSEAMIAPELTTDTKIIPLQVEKYLLQGMDLAEAFRRAVYDFEGSHAIVMQSNVEPGKTYLALKGSGQSIYVGLCKDQYVLSSELYGLVEETPYFIKMDGEKPSPRSESVTGQILILDQESPGGASGVKGLFYDGTSFSPTEADVRLAEITTRDIDRGAFPHFFLKEISEAALSVKKTLRGKYRITAKKEVIFNLGEDILPKKLKKGLAKGDIKNIYVIGHGTAAVAGSAIADGLSRYLKGTHIHIEAKRASELSGFSLEQDLRGSLIIAVTQSGTTTDTNRAVSMAAERGGHDHCCC